MPLSWCLHSFLQGHYERSRTAPRADNVSPMELSHPASCLTQNLTIAPQAQSVFLTRAPDCTKRLKAGLVLTQTQTHVAIVSGKRLLRAGSHGSRFGAGTLVWLIVFIPPIGHTNTRKEPTCQGKLCSSCPK